MHCVFQTSALDFKFTVGNYFIIHNFHLQSKTINIPIAAEDTTEVIRDEFDGGLQKL